jgi:hypothetical protein
MNASYTLSSDIIKMCKHFAEKCVITNIDEYKKRNQSDIDKIKNDIQIGKMAEFAVYYILLNAGKNNITLPDLNIYNKSKKSFDADLINENKKIHIKSQTKESADAFGESWLFQKVDPIVINASDDDHFIGTKVDFKTGKIEITLSKPVTKLVFSKPKLQKLQGTKVCVYLKQNS